MSTNHGIEAVVRVMTAGDGRSLEVDALHGEIVWQSPDGTLSLALAASPSGAGDRSRSTAALAALAERMARRFRQRDPGWASCDDVPTAAVAVDRTQDRVEASVDPAGVHGLYYRTARGLLQVSTRVQPLLDGLGGPAGVRQQSLYDYVYFSAVPSPQSFYEGICKLPAGFLLLWNGREASTRRYFDVQFAESTERDLGTLQTELRDRLGSAVARATGSCEAPGAFLSGGLDSSTVAGLLATQRRPAPTRTFSIGFQADGYDEIGYARIAAAHFGTEQHEHYVTPEDVLDCIREVSAAADEPFGNSSVLPAYFCARLARENGVTRLLAGDGGDELFAGNSRYAKQLLFERYLHLPRAVRHSVLEPMLLDGLGRHGPFRKLASYVRQARIPLPDRLQTYNYLHRHSPSSIFSAAFLDAVDPDAPLRQIREEYDVHASSHPIDRMLFLDWKFTLHDNDLVKVNTACRLAGMDVAYPMLDPDLIRFSCELPGPLKLHRRRLRWFYKQAMRGLLPAEIIDKRKHGFGLPFGVWMSTHAGLRAMAVGALEALRERQIFRPEFLSEVLRLHGEDAASYYGELIWMLTVLEIWLQTHDVRVRF